LKYSYLNNVKKAFEKIKKKQKSLIIRKEGRERGREGGKQ
jgi:hypothetical protein